MKAFLENDRIIGPTLVKVFTTIVLLAGIQHVKSQEARFFRISGPVTTSIIAFRTDGSLVWSNALPGATYTVQTATAKDGGSNWADYINLPTSASINTNQLIAFNPPSGMVLIPGGSFIMGDSLDGESDAPPNTTAVSAFYMDKYLVTYGQWLSVYSYAVSNGFVFYHAGGGSIGYPVVSVDWYDCVKWRNARSLQAGLVPAYYTDAGLSKDYTNQERNAIYRNWNANGYRLPTEAEWEKAARGGLTGLRFPWGNTISESQANYMSNPSSYPYDLGPAGYHYPLGEIGTSPVGSFSPNEYGLYDMCGNTFEWCWDWYQVDFNRVERGGSWFSTPNIARCCNRNASFPYYQSTTIGFRCVVKGP